MSFLRRAASTDLLWATAWFIGVFVLGLIFPDSLGWSTLAATVAFVVGMFVGMVAMSGYFHHKRVLAEAGDQS